MATVMGMDSIHAIVNTPSTQLIHDCMYWIHDSLMFNSVTLDAVGIDLNAALEEEKHHSMGNPINDCRMDEQV